MARKKPMPGRDTIYATAFVSVAATTTLFFGSVSSATPGVGVHRLAECAPSAIRSQGQTMMEWALMDVQSSARTVSSMELPAWLAQAENGLADLGRLPDNWGGSEKPSEQAIQTAQSLVRSMERHGHRVLDIAPIADGGIAVYYVEEDERHARFDVDNDGGILVATRAGDGTSTQYAELPEVDAVAVLSRFLQYDDDATPEG
jgi:hypothetical protein